MKQITLALAILGVATSILDIQEGRAADPYSPDVPESYEAPAYAFTGFGVGVDGGGQFGSTQLNGADDDGLPGKDGDSFDGISSDGFVGGGHLEYLFAVERFRFGAYGEGGFSNANTTFKGFGFDGDVQTMDHYYGAGLKAGATVYGNTLVYARAGYDWSKWSSEAPGVSETADVGSWLIGGGIETMVADHWSLGLGADYLMVNDVEFEGDDATAFVEDSEMLRIKARLTRRF